MRTPAPRTRALAGKLRPFVAELAGTARPTGGHAGDDRVARAGQAVRAGIGSEKLSKNRWRSAARMRPQYGIWSRRMNSSARTQNHSSRADSNATTVRFPRCRSTTYYSASPPRVLRWRDEPDHASFGTRQ